MLIGIDDTDSINGMCTTYLAAKICRVLDVNEPPTLVRLNPNIPYKTRGNGAIAIKSDNPNAEETVLSYVKKYAVFSDHNTNPGVAFLHSDQVKDELVYFYRKAVSQLVTIEEAENVADKTNVKLHKYKNGRGIIGALAALGFMGERTYELIAYRMPENYGKSREIDRNSVLAMNDRYYPRVFDNLDLKRKRILITPCGYDPILCGIRGLTEHDVLSAWRMIKPREPVEFTQLFATNQATDAHLVNKRITEVKPYDCVILSGKVASNPKTVPGGHVIFRISDKTGSIYCAAYKKTGLLRDIASQLVVGDDITAYGGICKHKETVNLEKLEIRRLEKILKFMHPLCCGKRMSSAGKNKGYKCKKCGKKISQRFVELSQVNRSIKPGIYDVQPGSRRHLSKPLFLYGFLGGKSGK